MAIDGTWERECRIGDVSDTGAKLTIHGSVDGVDTREFFLVLTPGGTAHRRCERIWLNGDEIGVRFLKDAPGRLPRRRQGADASEPRAEASARPFVMIASTPAPMIPW